MPAPVGWSEDDLPVSELGEVGDLLFADVAVVADVAILSLFLSLDLLRLRILLFVTLILMILLALVVVCGCAVLIRDVHVDVAGVFA